MLKRTSEHLQALGITAPTLMVDEARARANIRAMAARAARGGVCLRPHFKTHQSVAVGSWFAAEGVTAIAVSSLAMAEYFAAGGWRDITLAILCHPRERDRLHQLAQSLAAGGGRLGLCVDDPAVAVALFTGWSAPAEVWIKVDTGYGRTGSPWDDSVRLAAIREAVPAAVRVAGLLTHTGHSYQARGAAALEALYRETARRLDAARASLGDRRLQISLGDTPCCSVADPPAGCDEIRPGNFVFYDLMQRQIGACGDDQLAVMLACPVLGVYPARGEIVIHGGAVHLSKESLRDADGTRSYGRLGTVEAANGARRLGRVVPQTRLVALSQEHGIVAMGAAFADLGGNLVAGDLVAVWPVHACLTCDLQPHYLTLAGDMLTKRR